MLMKTKKTPLILRIIKAIFTLILILMVVGTAATAGFVYITIQNAPRVDIDMIAPKQEATYIYDVDGQREQKLTMENANREIAPLSSIPVHLQHAFIAIEDMRFYQHKGIDPIGIVRAGRFRRIPVILCRTEPVNPRYL